ncbi:MAG: septum formation initiator family protein [Lachnospiraceae bacterium]
MSTEKNSARRKYVRRSSAREQKRHLRMTFLGIGLLLIFAAVLLVYKTGQLQIQKQQYVTQTEQLKAEIEKEESRKEELLRKKTEVSSDAYIESEARKRLNYVHKDEILIKRKQ